MSSLSNIDIDQEDMFGPEHLAFLIHKGLVPQVFNMGPLVNIFAYPGYEDGGEYAHQLRAWGVLTENNEFTPQGRALFTGITHYTSAVWGVIYLHNQKQPYTVDLSEELIEWGLDKTLTDVPKVFWQVSVGYGLVYTMVRAGERISITARPQDESSVRELAKGIQRVIDPNNEWSPIPGPSMSFPGEQLASNEVSFAAGESEAGNSIRALKRALREFDVPDKWVERYVDLQKKEHVASVSINHSEHHEDVSEISAQLFFLLNEGIQLTRSKKGLDGIYRVIIEPATVDNLEEAVKTLQESKHSERPGLSQFTF